MKEPFENQDFNKENEEDDPFADDNNSEIKNKFSNVNQTKKSLGLFEQKLNSNNPLDNISKPKNKITDEFGFELDHPKNLFESTELPNLNLNKLAPG